MDRNDVFACPNARCGCEIVVTRAPREGQQINPAPICTCGAVMRKR